MSLFPMGLQGLTFGDDFNQSLENATLLMGLQSLTVGDYTNRILENATHISPMARPTVVVYIPAEECEDTLVLAVDYNGMPTMSGATDRIPSVVRPAAVCLHFR